MAKYTKFSVKKIQNNLYWQGGPPNFVRTSFYCDFVMMLHVRTTEANFWGGRHTKVRRNKRYDSCLWIVEKYIERLFQMEEWNSILGIMKDKSYASTCYLLCGYLKKQPLWNWEKFIWKQLWIIVRWISTKIVIRNKLQMNKNASSSESSYYLSGGQ